MKDDLVERLQERAAELPQEIADRDNEAAGECGPWGTYTAADYVDDYDVALLAEAASALAALNTANKQLKADNTVLVDALEASNERMISVLTAMDKYNEANSTYIIGPSLLGCGKQVADNQTVINQQENKK